jgi:hypothetical protein
VLGFLDNHLPLWTADRAARNDYRILGLDSYSAHKSEAIVNLAWERGYIAGQGSMIPGGLTGMLAGPDTDLHAWMEQELIAMQTVSQHSQLAARPHKVPTETGQSMANYATSIWEFADHTQGK